MRELKQGEVVMTKNEVKEYIASGNYVHNVERDGLTDNCIVMTYQSYMEINAEQIREFELIQLLHRLK